MRLARAGATVRRSSGRAGLVTAVPGLSAKPTIDILMVVDSSDDFLQRLPAVEALGYDYRASNTFVGSDVHLFLRKVADGKRTHHLHVLSDRMRYVAHKASWVDDVVASLRAERRT